jgi:putative transposase
MKLTIQAKITPSEPDELLAVMRQFNNACNWLSVYAFNNQVFNWYKLQKTAYHQIRGLFKLTSDQSKVAIRKVTNAYKLKSRRNKVAKFKPLGAMPLYGHSYKKDGTVLIYGHRYPIHTHTVLNAKSEGKLCYRRGEFIVHQAIETAVIEPYIPGGYLGCDLGIVNILVSSDGEIYSSGHLNGLRKRYQKVRSRLQKKKTKSAKRLLQHRRKKERLFARSVNHNISKQVVAKAKDAMFGIALEDLSGIRDRITVKKAQRRQHHSWSFGQLRIFIEYKANLNGVPVVFVDPRNTSRTCSECGYVDKKNRKSQSEFVCNSCGFADLADYVAARNIARRADGNQPDGASQDSSKPLFEKTRAVIIA